MYTEEIFNMNNGHTDIGMAVCLIKDQQYITGLKMYYFVNNVFASKYSKP